METVDLIEPLAKKRPHCVQCDFELWSPIHDFGFAYLGLYDDARFPGRCILSLNEHFDTLNQVPDTLYMDFMLAIRESSMAILNATGCQRVNVAILGNREPHVHAHLIPRQPQQEPFPNDAPWRDKRKKISLPRDRRFVIVKEIARQLL